MSAFSLLGRVAITGAGRGIGAAIGRAFAEAYPAVYLASPAASWVTGTLLKIDGGTVDEIVPMVRGR